MVSCAFGEWKFAARKNSLRSFSRPGICVFYADPLSPIGVGMVSYAFGEWKLAARKNSLRSFSRPFLASHV